MHHGRRDGFTLIELLVVIAIISILASILFPVFARAREKGRQTACVANVHQIEMAFHMYAQDYDETVAPGYLGANQFWYDLIFPYTHNRQIYVCPSRKDRQMGYGVNNLICGGSEGSMFDPSVKIEMMDVPPEAIGATANSMGNEWWCNPLDPTMATGIIPAPLPAGVTDGDNTFRHNSMPERHNDGVIVGYGDGHAKWGKESQLNQAYMWVPGLETPR